MPSALGVQNNFSQQLQDSSNEYSTDYQKSIYQNIETNKIKIISSYLFYIFYAVILILCYFLYIQPTMSYKIKLLIIFLFATYPFYIYSLERVGYSIIMYIYAFMTGTVYNP